jgi:hypothetical protein
MSYLDLLLLPAAILLVLVTAVRPDLRLGAGGGTRSHGTVGPNPQPRSREKQSGRLAGEDPPIAALWGPFDPRR